MALQPFPHYGSKVMKQSFIQPKLPETDKFIVPYGGSATILLNREPSGLEVLNDINGHIMTFFRVLRDNPTELIQKCEYTPYHEGEFENAFEILDNSDEYSDVEVARAWFVRKTCAYNAGSTSFAYSTKEIRRDMSQHVSRYRSKIGDLNTVVDRLQRVQFMNRDALDVLQRFDKEGALHHADPPYPHWTRSGTAYEHEMDRDDHREMLEVMRDMDCKVAVSTYETDFYTDILGDGWDIHRDESKGTGATNSGDEKVEALYVNYDT